MTQKDGNIKRKVGRPTSLTKHKIAILIDAFKNGATTGQALILSKISKDSYYNALKDPIFKDKVEYAKKYPNVIAKKNIVNKINEGDVDTSKWWTERREREQYGTNTGKVEIENANIIGYINVSQEKQLKEPNKQDYIDLEPLEEENKG